MPNQPSNTTFYSQIVDLLQSARSQVVRTVNQTMVLTYFEIGRMIDNLQNMRRFYLVYQKYETLSSISENQKQQTPSRVFNLSWSHYLKLMRIDDENERKFYEIESYKNCSTMKRTIIIIN